MSEHTREEEKPSPVGQSAAFAGSTFVTMGLVDLLAHLGPTGLLVGGLASYVAWKHGPEVYEHLRDLLPPPAAPSEEEQVASEEASAPRASRTGGRSLVDRALGRFPDPVAEVGEEKRPSGEANRERQAAPQQRPQPTEARGEEVAFDLDGEEDMPRPSMQESTFLFSAVLE